MASGNSPALSADADSGSRKRIEIKSLDPGLRATYSVEPGNVLFFDLDIDEVGFSREANSMLLHQENGAVITLQGMFAPGNSGYPDFELQGGIVISGQDFLSTLSPRLDTPEQSPPQPAPSEGEFVTAAGPQSPAPSPDKPASGSGVGEFRNDGGELLGSVERFGFGLGLDGWDNSTLGVSELPEAIHVQDVDISIRDPFGGGPGGPFASEAGLTRGTGLADNRFTGWHEMVLPEGIRVSGVPEGGSAVFTGEYGELVISHTGGSTYSYQYELKNRYVHDAARGEDELGVDAEIIRFGITDGSNTGTAGIAVDIGDDRPTLSVAPSLPGFSGHTFAGTWSGSYGADGQNLSDARRLTFYDEQGNETTVSFNFDEAVRVVVGGTFFGTMEFKSGGSYEFHAAANLEARLRVVMGLVDRDNDFVQDNDGQGIVFEITKPVKNIDPLGSRGEWFSEQNLPEGTAADESETTREIFVPEGYYIDTDEGDWEFLGFHESWNGAAVNADVYVKSHSTPQNGNGYLTCFVDDDGSQRLVYTLEKPLTHKLQGTSHDDPAYATVGKVTLVDEAGNSYEVDTRFTVYDDEPAISLSGSGTAQSGYEYNGAWSLMYGADGAAEGDDRLSISITITVGGTSYTASGPIAAGQAFAIEAGGQRFGSITLKDGSFSFKPASNLTADFAITLSAKDADGDIVSTSPFVIKVSPGTPSLPDHLGDGADFDEANLVAGGATQNSGTRPDEAALTQNIDIPDGFTISTAGWTSAGADTWTLAGQYGFLTYSTGGGQSLSYTLTNPPQVAGDGANITQDSIGITLLDGGLNSVNLPVVVDIADDVPLSMLGSNDNKDSVSLQSGALYDNGKWFVNYGADGKAGDDSLTLTVAMGGETFGASVEPGGGPITILLGGKEYGVISFEENGSYSFRAAANTSGELLFTLTGKDGDGDEVSSSTFAINVRPAGGPPDGYYLGGNGEKFDEAFLQEGTSPGQGELTQELLIYDGYTIDTTGWTEQSPGVFTLGGQNNSGVLTYHAGGNTVTYTLQSAKSHGAPNSATDTSLEDVFSGIKLKDKDGNIFDVPARITVLDDAPLLAVVSGGSTSIGGDIFDFTTAGAISVNFGADGDGNNANISVRLAFTYNKESGAAESGVVSLDLPRTGEAVAFESAMGRGTVRYDAATGSLRYTYEALRGRQGESEGIVFAARDGDGDYGQSNQIVLSLLNSVPAAIFNVDEAGLAIGSGADGHGAASDAGSISITEMPDETSSVEWNTTAISPCFADANDDGKYSQVTWTQEGNRLCGYAENVLVAEITPEFANGEFTGRMTAEIHSAFKHDGGSGDDIRLLLNLALKNASGDSKESTVALVIKDDEPFGNTGAANSLENKTSFEEFENGANREDLFLVVDVSGSVSTEDMIKQINALRFLVERYVESGIDVNITLVPFASNHTVRMDGADAETFLAALSADQTGIAYLKQGIWDGTNYTSALDATLKLVQQAYASSASAVNKKVFFLSDGGQDWDQRNDFLDSWAPFRDGYSDLAVYALGVGGVFTDPNGDAFKGLVNVAGDEKHVITVDDYDSLGETLSGLVTPEFDNLLKDVRSADLTKILSVYIGSGIDANFELVDNNDATGLKNTGPIDLGNGISLTVYENGDYLLATHQNVPSDLVYKIGLTTVDADGDTYTSGLMNFTVKDHLPAAYDKVATLAPGYRDTSVFGIFVLDADKWNIDGWIFSPNFPIIDTKLPAGMEAFVLDPALIPYTERGCFGLKTDRTLSQSNIESFIGSGNSLPDVLADEGILSSGNIAGNGGSLHVNMMSKEFTSKGGEIIFNWSFSGRYYEGEEDVAFWLLLDENDNVVASGKISDYRNQADEVQYLSGIETVKIEETATEQTYKFVVGAADGGTSNEANAFLLLNTLLLTENRYHFGGNLLSDESSSGEADQLLDNAAISHVVYNGQEYAFDASGSLSIAMGSGTFTLNKSGAYTFVANDGNVIGVNETVTYYLQDRDGDTAQASLSIQGGGRSAFTAVAADEHGFDQARLLGGFEGSDETATLGGDGWYITHATQFASGEAQLPNALPVPDDRSISAHLGQPYPWVRMHGKDNFTPRQRFALFDTNDEDEIREVLLSAGLAPATFEDGASTSLAGAAMQKSFTSKGGEIAFGWSFAGGSGEADAAFWILKDGDGNPVDSGLLRQGGKDNGVLHIPVPYSAEAQEHTLLIGTLKTGSAEDLEPVLYVSNVVLLEDEYHFKGNVLAAPDAEAALYEDLRLESVTFGEETARFDLQHQQHEFTAESGRLLIDWKGNYTFRANDPDASIEGEHFSYRLRGESAGQSGELLVRVMDPVVHDTMAEYYADQAYHFGGNLFLQPSPLGEYDDVSAGTEVRQVEYAGKVYEMNDAEALSILTATGGELVIHRDGSYFFTDGPGSDGSSVVEDFYYTVADARGHTDSALLSIRGPQCRVGGDIEHEDGAGQIGYGAQDFVGLGFGDELAGAHGFEALAGQGTSPLFLAVSREGAMPDESASSAVAADDTAGAQEGAGEGVQVLDIFDENGQFKWDPQGKSPLAGVPATEADKLHFGSLVEASENIDELLIGKQLLNCNLDTDNGILSFALVDDLLVKEVEIRVSPVNDTAYGDMLAEYLDAGSESAQQEVLAQFLLSLSVH